MHPLWLFPTKQPSWLGWVEFFASCSNAKYSLAVFDRPLICLQVLRWRETQSAEIALPDPPRLHARPTFSCTTLRSQSEFWKMSVPTETYFCTAKPSFFSMRPTKSRTQKIDIKKKNCFPAWVHIHEFHQLLFRVGKYVLIGVTINSKTIGIQGIIDIKIQSNNSNSGNAYYLQTVCSIFIHT